MNIKIHKRTEYVHIVKSKSINHIFKLFFSKSAAIKFAKSDDDKIVLDTIVNGILPPIKGRVYSKSQWGYIVLNSDDEFVEAFFDAKLAHRSAVRLNGSVLDRVIEP